MKAHIPPKFPAVEKFYGKTRDALLYLWYRDQQLSSTEISEKILKEVGIDISYRTIQRHVRTLGIQRSYSEAFNLCIAKGRKSYDRMRKSVKAKELRKGIALAQRYAILKRDGFRCVTCGATARNEQLVIDHIVAVTKGGTNTMDNLQVLCRPCNVGKRTHEKER